MNILENPNYKIIKYSPIYFQKYKELFNISYLKTNPLNFSNDRLLKTPFGKTIIFLMKYKNEIVGSHSLFPVKFRIKNNDFLCGLGHKTMTHPQHRGKGIFQALAKKTHEVAKKKKYSLTFASANDNSINIYEKKLGHLGLGPINLIKIKKINFSLKKYPEVKYHFFPKEIKTICDSTKHQNFSVGIKRDFEFINWRYRDNPEFRYLTCYKPGKFFFIFKKYFNSFHIVDFYGNSPDLEKTLISTAINTAKKLSCKEVTMWIPKKHKIMNILGQKSIIRKKSNLFFHIMPLNDDLVPSLMNFDNWFYTMAEGDVF